MLYGIGDSMVDGLKKKGGDGGRTAVFTTLFGGSWWGGEGVLWRVLIIINSPTYI